MVLTTVRQSSVWWEQWPRVSGAITPFALVVWGGLEVAVSFGGVVSAAAVVVSAAAVVVPAAAVVVQTSVVSANTHQNA